MEKLPIGIHCHTTRILFEEKKAIGVGYIKNKKVYCNLEVIISAGTVNSPQLLQLSEIGPVKLLNQFEIPVIKNSPAVGGNLQDHLAYTHYYHSKVATLNNQLYPRWGKILVGIQYILTRKGRSLSALIKPAVSSVAIQAIQPTQFTNLFFRTYLQYHAQR